MTCLDEVKISGALLVFTFLIFFLLLLFFLVLPSVPNEKLRLKKFLTFNGLSLAKIVVWHVSYHHDKYFHS